MQRKSQHRQYEFMKNGITKKYDELRVESDYMEEYRLNVIMSDMEHPDADIVQKNILRTKIKNKIVDRMLMEGVIPSDEMCKKMRDIIWHGVQYKA